MKRYDEKVLNGLLDRYENSLLYTGENRRNQKISFPVGKKQLPEYFDESSQEYAVIHAQLLELEKKGLVTLRWKNGKAGHILESCVLVTDRADEAYAILRRLPKRCKEEKMLEICRNFSGRHPVLDRFLIYLAERIKNGEGIGQYADMDRPEELSERCALILQILNNQEEIFLREFSIRYRNDSKAVEKEAAGAAGIIARFSEGGQLQNLTAWQVLEEYNIYKNPSWVMVKGCGHFQMAESCVCLENLLGGIGLSSRDICSVRWEGGGRFKQVITIENLTSFHRFQEPDTLAIYLGGYHNQVKRTFLQQLHQSCPRVLYAHFGDIDCGGFLIWKDLCQKTGIPFATRFMDTETYLRYADLGKELTEHDRKELGRMMEDPFFAGQRELFEMMLKTGKKLEQEGIVR